MSDKAEVSPSIPSKSRRGVIVSIVIVIIAVAAFSAYWFFLKPSSPTYSWLFEGAYATYKGSMDVIGFSINVTMRLEVLEFNETRAELLTYTKVKTLFVTLETYGRTWVNLKEGTYDMRGYNLKGTYEQDIYVEGLGTRNCIIYEFEGEDQSMIIMYVDKEIVWPIKIKMFSTSTFAGPLDLNLIETNITELK